jgi:hypothetical protein
MFTLPKIPMAGFAIAASVRTAAKVLKVDENFTASQKTPSIPATPIRRHKGRGQLDGVSFVAGSDGTVSRVPAEQRGALDGVSLTTK